MDHSLWDKIPLEVLSLANPRKHRSLIQGNLHLIAVPQPDRVKNILLTIPRKRCGLTAAAFGFVDKNQMLDWNEYNFLLEKLLPANKIIYVYTATRQKTCNH